MKIKKDVKVHGLWLKWSIIIVSIALLSLSILFAFMWISQHPTYEQIERRLNRNEQLWKSKALSNYSFKLIIMPAPCGPWTGFVVVKQADSTVIYEHDDADFVDFVSYYYDDADSINKLFSIIRRTLQGQDVNDGIASVAPSNSPSREMPDIFDVLYDPALGYPSRIYIMPNKNANDGFIIYEVSDFKITN
jgi:hypothetical protein